MRFLLTIFFALSFFSGFAEESFFLKSNLERAERGDYIVIAQGRNYTLFHVFDKQKESLTIEEVTIPTILATEIVHSWKSWLASNAPQHTSWVIYEIDLAKGCFYDYYSFTKNCWLAIDERDNFLQTLLKLSLYKVPSHLRRKVGHAPRGNESDKRSYWQPKMVVEGSIVPGVSFDAYYAKWPEDGGVISGKAIEIYLPQDSTHFPAYFPYWLQVKGLVGPAKVRVVDSGKGAISPKSGFRQVINNSSST